MYDLAEAARFLRMLDPAATRFTFQSFDDDVDRNDKSLTHIIHGSLEQCQARLRRLNNAGAGIFVTINATDFKGRKAENIVRVRAIYADLDGAPLEPVLAARLQPHVIVESSANRFHCYWLVGDGMPLEDFGAVQLAVIERFNSDRSVHDLPRVMRVPGFVHAKVKNGIRSNPFLTRIISTHDDPPYLSVVFERAKVEPHTPGRRSEATLLEQWTAATALEIIPNDDLDWKPWNRIGMATWQATGGSQYGFEAFDTFSKKSSKYKARRTADIWEGYERSPPDQLNIGTLIFLANEVDPNWRDRLLAEMVAVLSGDQHG